MYQILQYPILPCETLRECFPAAVLLLLVCSRQLSIACIKLIVCQPCNQWNKQRISSEILIGLHSLLPFLGSVVLIPERI